MGIGIGAQKLCLAELRWFSWAELFSLAQQLCLVLEKEYFKIKHDIHHIRKRKTVKQETCSLFQVHAHRSHLRPPTRRINPKHVPCKVLRQTQVWRFLASKTLGKFTLNFQNCNSLCHYTLRVFTQSADASPIPVQILGEPNMCQSMIASSVRCWRIVAPTFPVSSHAVTVHISH